MNVKKFLSGDSEDSAANNGNDAVFAPNGLTEAYYAVGDTRSLVGDLAEVQYGEGTLTSEPTSDDPLQVRWWAALNEVKNALGKLQATENSFSLKDEDASGNTYADTFGHLPTIDTAGLQAPEERALEDAGLDPSDYGRGKGPQMPVPTGHTRLPIAVTKEDELEKALEALQAFVNDEFTTYDAEGDNGTVCPAEATEADVDDASSDDGSDDDGSKASGDKRECTHCGGLFDPRGIQQHEKACDGGSEADDGEEASDDEPEPESEEVGEREAYVANLIQGGCTPEEAEAAAAVRFD